jgi:hypothetical protein
MFSKTKAKLFKKLNGLTKAFFLGVVVYLLVYLAFVIALSLLMSHNTSENEIASNGWLAFFTLFSKMCCISASTFAIGYREAPENGIFLAPSIFMGGLFLSVILFPNLVNIVYVGDSLLFRTILLAVGLGFYTLGKFVGKRRTGKPHLPTR